MKQHIRVDAFKVFDDDHKALELIQKEEKIKNKSGAYRLALAHYVKNKELNLQIEQLQNELHGARTDIAELKTLTEGILLYLQTNSLENNKKE